MGGGVNLNAYQNVLVSFSKFFDEEVALRGEVHNHWNFNFAIGVNRSGLRSFKKQFPTSL